MIEQDLLLAGHGKNGCPRTVGESGDGVRALGHDRGLQNEVLRHGRGPFGFSRGGNGIEIDFGFVGFFGLGAFCLEESAGDPVGNDFQLFVCRFGAFRGHDGFLGVRGEGVET